MTAIAGFDGHQGVALVVAPRRWATLDDVIVRALEAGQRPFVLALDSLEDPHNVGSLLRTAEAAGVHGVVFPTRRSAPLSPSAVKASAGAVEHLLLVPVDDLPGALADLHVRGLRIVGADQSATLTYREADLRGPLVVVVGSEGQGLGPAIRRRLDLDVRIPMHGRIASLNAAVAGSVLLLEAAGQRAPGAPPPVDDETVRDRARVEPEAPSEPDLAPGPEAPSEHKVAPGPKATSDGPIASEPDAAEAAIDRGLGGVGLGSDRTVGSGLGPGRDLVLGRGLRPGRDLAFGRDLGLDTAPGPARSRRRPEEARRGRVGRPPRAAGPSRPRRH